ncbi:MAG: TonB-dependent receptor, partial [Steroidobacteraceae bacterium]
MKKSHGTLHLARLVGGALLVSTAAVCGQAWAQDAPAAAQASGAAANSGGLQEITVTATHISTGVNHVPMTIAAIPQNELDQIGITDAANLAAAVPGLGTSTGFFGTVGKQTFTIRGIGATTGAATTGVYLNDVPLTQYFGTGVDQNNGAPVPELFDLERVEVLKGPQGTLYGGSSEGGTIRFITPTPSLTQYSGTGRAQVENGEWGEPGYLFGVAGGGPIVPDKAGFRLSLVEHKIGGYINEFNPYSTSPSPYSSGVPAGTAYATNVNSEEEFAGQASILFALTDKATLQLSYYHHQDYLNANVGVTEPLPAGTTYATGPTCYNDAAARVGHGAPPKVNCPAAGTALPAGVYEQPSYTFGPFPYLNGSTATIVGNSYLGYPPSSGLTKMQVPSMTFAYDFGQIQLKSITSYVRTFTHAANIDRNVGGRSLSTTEYPHSVDFPLNGGDPNYTGYADNENVGSTVTQEFRVTNPGSADSRWSWVAGLYYSRSRLFTSYNLYTPTNTTTEELFGISSYQYFGVPDQPADQTGYYRLYVTNTEDAAYGNVNFKVTPKLTLTAGLRISSEEQNFWQINYGQESDDLADNPNAVAAGSRHNVPVSPLATVQYNFTPDDMVYVTASKGFRVGGVNEPLNPTDCNVPLDTLYGLSVQDIPKTYGPDEVWSYELGTKMRMLDNRMQLNLGVYWINWTGIQASVPIPPGCNTGWIENGGQAVSRGVDFQLLYKPVDSLNFNLRTSYDDAYYSATLLGPTPLSGAAAAVLIQGGKKFNIPPFTGDLTAQYTFHLFGHKNYIRSDWQYQGSYSVCTDYPLAGFSPYCHYPAWFLVNLRAGMSFNWGDIELYSNNVLNRQ